MKQIRNLLLRILVSLLMGVNTYGQNNINFSYECSDNILSPTSVRILLKSPDSKSFNLFTDTLSRFTFTEKNFFKLKGEYILSIWFYAGEYGSDSLEYSFELNGGELNTSISLSFDYKEKLIRKENFFVKGERILNGYIRINKYYDAPKSLEIELDKEISGDKYYKKPFFKIRNNSQDTLYGEHLPGYFWGSLSYIRNDSILATKIGIIDYEFIESPPLYPDSTKIATVGSFGVAKELNPFEYRFEVLLAKKWQSQGIGIYKEQELFNWWAGIKEYYKLIYDFNIENQTPNR